MERLAVFLLLALTYAQFFQAATWGAACRFDLARALAEQGTVRIDAYHENTGDKAFVAGHYYSDKGPLPSVLAVPAVLAMQVLPQGGEGDASGDAPGEARRLAWTAGLAAFFASGLPAALAGTLFFVMLRARGAPRRHAALAVLFVFLGTTILPYATLLQSHALAAAGVLLFFHTMFPPAGDATPRRALWGGAAASAVVATEIFALPALAAIFAVALVRSRGGAPRLAWLVAAGAAPILVLLGIYNEAAFGSPFAFGYQFVALPFFQTKMAGGLFGIGAPNPTVAAQLLFGSYRGLFFAAPILLAALGGLMLAWRVRERRAEVVAILLAFVLYVALNSGYTSWHGGWAIGPRHLVPAIPLLGLGLPAAIARFPRLVTILGLVSMLFMLAATSVQPEVPEDISNPLFDRLLPKFVSGELSVSEQGFDDLHPARKVETVPDRWDAFVLGEALGLPGLTALLTLAIPFAIFGRRILAK